MASQSGILRPGRTCWRIEPAGRLALIVDAADYFKAVKEAILAARHSVYLIGWDFDTRIKFEPDGKTLEGPNKLGPFLRWIDRNRPGVEVHVLKWDLGIVLALGRGTTPIAVLDWMTSERIHFRLDSAHPPGAAHHQKVVVIDDRLAFCGGIDMTADRWDTREHRDRDPRRRRPSGWRYDPWHDAATLVDGDVARALGELARGRWERAGGKPLQPPPDCDPIWPASIRPDLTDVEVGIARTIPEYGDTKPAHEIEALHLDAIAAAERTIYCESQYFACRRIAEAMAKRLREADGPEIVVVNPRSADGWLEAATMDSARHRLLGLVRKADRHGRFRIYTPVTQKGAPIYVHAKVMVVDDRLLRVGSSNLNNRSMGFDSECDLIIEAVPRRRGAPALRKRITAMRDDLLAEHLGTTAKHFAAKLGETGSLVATIEALRGSGRTLVPYESDAPGPIEDALAESDLVDPERPPDWRRILLRRLMPKRWAFR